MIINLLISLSDILWHAPVKLPGQNDSSTDRNATVKQGTGLSATAYSANGSFPSQQVLVFENASGNITFLTHNVTSDSSTTEPWVDLSTELYLSLPNAPFGVPFTSCWVPNDLLANYSRNDSVANAQLALTFFDSHATRDQDLVETIFNITTGTFSSRQYSLKPTDEKF